MSERWEDELRRRLVAEAQAKFDLRVDTFSQEVRERCESPIERLLAVQFASLDWELGEGGRLAWEVDPGLDSIEKFKDYLQDIGEDAARFRCGSVLWGGWTGIIAPQVVIGQWRVDFLAGAVFCGAHGQADKPMSLLAIECDGHDFHERTKEQASRDKKRDRQIQASGVSLFRFTGSQIYRNPEACAGEIVDFFVKWAEPHYEDFLRRIRRTNEIPGEATNSGEQSERDDG